MKKYLNQIICFLLLLWGFSPWIIQLTVGHYYLELMIIVVVLFLLLIEEKIKNFKYLVFLFPLIYLIFSCFYFQTIFKLNELDIYDINQRRQYYPPSVARIFENKLGRYFYYYENSFFQATDFNYYFFANHPRERAGITETKKISFFFLPLFILGLYRSLINKKFIWLFYFIFTLSLVSFFNPIDSFIFLFLPFFVINIDLGCMYIFKKLKLFSYKC